MKDTSEDMQERYEAMLMALSPGERVAMACRMFNTAKALAIAGIQHREGPIDDPVLLRQKLFLHFYRDDFTPEETERILAHIAKVGE